MGRITLFVADGCPLSIASCKALDELDLPYHKINLTAHPDRILDMKLQSDRLTLPQVYFNTRFVGHFDDLFELLHEWKRDKRRYSCPYERYKVEVAALSDPSNPRLNTTSDTLPFDKVDDIDFLHSLEYEAILDTVSHPTGPKPHLQVLQELERIIPRSENTYRLQVYPNSFTRSQFCKALECEYDLTREEAVAWGRRWEQEGLLDHVTGSHHFDAAGVYFFRLQPDMQPLVVNTWCTWNKSLNTKPPMDILYTMHRLLNMILTAVTDSSGCIDYVQAAQMREYVLLRYYACQLQVVDLAAMDETTRLAFGINASNILLKMAHVYCGFGESDSRCLAYMDTVKINIGGFSYSFTEWRNGILRANAKKCCGSPTLSVSDQRARFALTKVDPRMHFALEWGIVSSHPVRFYRPETLEQDLDIAACAYCEQHVHIDVDKHQVKLPKILALYKVDFVTSSQELPGFIMPYLQRIQRQQMEKLLYKRASIKFVYADYEWNVRASEILQFDPSLLRRAKVKVKHGIQHGLSRLTQLESDLLTGGRGIKDV
jgi:glutaredoxin